MRCLTPDLCAEERAAAMRHTAKLRNRIEAYLTGLAGAADTAGDSRPWAQAPPGWWRSRPDPRWRSGRDGEHRQRPARPAGREGCLGCRAVFGVMYQIRPTPRPGIDDFTTKQAAIVGLAKLTDASEVRWCCRSPLRPTTPPTWTWSSDQQRAKRSPRCPPGRMGCGRSPGCSTRSTGRSWLKPGIVHPPPDTHADTTTPAQRRADAPTDMSKAAAANTHPGGVSAVSILVDLENRPTSDNAILVDGTPGCRFVLDLLSCAAVCTVIFGIKRKGTFIPSPSDENDVGIPAQWAALIRPRPRLHPLRTGPAAPPRHHIIHWKDGGRNRPVKPEPSSVRDVITTLHHGRYTITHGHPLHHPRHHPHPRTPIGMRAARPR